VQRGGAGRMVPSAGAVDHNAQRRLQADAVFRCRPAGRPFIAL